MRNIDMTELKQVAGGDNAEVDNNLGTGIAHFVHGMCSQEAALGAIISPVGAVVGAFIHFANKH